MTLLQSWENCRSKVSLPPHLPIAAQEEELTQAIRESQVVIIAGETGSGKTTQVPKLCIKAGLGKHSKILMTQPRRLAATRTAIRIAEEMELELGKEIGYRIRFNHRSSPETLLEIVTDGIPLSGNLKQDHFQHCEAVIVDEVHERSVNIDLILGLLKLARLKRPGLKVILMSATLDLEKLCDFFPEAKSFSISGRTHPVATEYVEIDKDSTLPENLTQQVMHEIRREMKGNLLCFLPTERDIRECEQKLNGQLPERFDCLPLYSRLSQKDQEKVFKTNPNLQKVILATNIAETSLTLPGIKTVIDSGYVRMLRYHAGRGIALLEVENISKASANQRSGRAGRTSPGRCVRLYTQEDYDLMEEHTIPEIKRQDLAQVILKLIALGLEQPENFPFVEKPQSKFFNKGLELLEFLQAIQKTDQGWSITNQGRGMVKLPLTPRLAHLLIHAKRDKLTAAMSVISAFLSIQDPKLTPADQLEASRDAHRLCQVKHSDFLGILKLFQTYHQEKRNLTQNQLKKWCRKNYLEWRRMREWNQLAHELCDLIKGKWHIQFDHINEIRFHQLILGSHLDCLLEKDQKSKRAHYHSFGRREIITHPSSSLASQIQDWAVCSGFLSTSQLFALHLCRIDPKWILQQAKSLMKVQLGDPFFDSKTQKVVSEERHIFREHVIHINPYKDYFLHDVNLATEVFIRQGILEGLCKIPNAEQFKTLIRDLESYDAAERTRSIYAHPDRLVEAWKQKWKDPCSRLSNLKKKPPQQQELELSDVLEQHELFPLLEDFPLSHQLGHRNYDIHYLYQPGAELDGACLHIDQAALVHLDQMDLERLVPRYFYERVHQAYQSLPNAFRKEFDENAFRNDLIERWHSLPDYSFPQLFQLWLEQLTQNQKAIERTLREFNSREESFKVPKLCLLDPKGKVQQIIHNITEYLGQSESSLIKKLAQRNRSKMEVKFPHLEKQDVPARCNSLLNELKQWPVDGKILAETPHQQIRVWPALIQKHELWKIIPHQNRERAKHLTLTHLGLCLGPMSQPDLSFDAEELDQLKDLRQGLQSSLHELKLVSRLSLWDRVRPQDLENYHSLSQRILQLEKKKWPKLARRWLKWFVLCTRLYQSSLDLKAKTPQEAELYHQITRITQSGAPKAKDLLSCEISELERETQEAFVLLNWKQQPDFQFDRAFLDLKKLKQCIKALHQHPFFKNLFPGEELSVEQVIKQPLEQITPETLKASLHALEQKKQRLNRFDQQIKESKQWLQELQVELQVPQHIAIKEKLEPQLQHLIQCRTESLDLTYLDKISKLKETWQELKENRFDILDQQPAIHPERLKQALIASWRTKK